MEERQEQERKKGHKKTSQGKEFSGGKENVDALRIVQFDETSRPFTDPDQNNEEPRSLFYSVCPSMTQCPDVEIYLQYIGKAFYNRHTPPRQTGTVKEYLSYLLDTLFPQKHPGKGFEPPKSKENAPKKKLPQTI